MKYLRIIFDHLYVLILGTPSESTWPGVCRCPYWRDNFPVWSRSLRWEALAPNMHYDAQSLVEVICVGLALLWFLIVTL